MLREGRAEREVFKGRGRKHGKDQWEKSKNTKPVEIFSPERSVSRTRKKPVEKNMRI